MAEEKEIVHKLVGVKGNLEPGKLYPLCKDRRWEEITCDECKNMAGSKESRDEK